MDKKEAAKTLFLSGVALILFAVLFYMENIFILYMMPMFLIGLLAVCIAAWYLVPQKPS